MPFTDFKIRKLKHKLKLSILDAMHHFENRRTLAFERRIAMNAVLNERWIISGQSFGKYRLLSKVATLIVFLDFGSS